VHNADSLVKGEKTNYLYIHPDDAARKGIQEGDPVNVRNLEGERVQVPCRISSDMMPGVVALPHGWGHRYAAGWRKANSRPGVNVNRLAPDSVWKLEPIAGMSWLNGIPVDIRKVQPRKTKTRAKEGGQGPGVRDQAPRNTPGASAGWGLECDPLSRTRFAQGDFVERGGTEPKQIETGQGSNTQGSGHAALP
jgi:hypothetical protein